MFRQILSSKDEPKDTLTYFWSSQTRFHERKKPSERPEDLVSKLILDRVKPPTTTRIRLGNLEGRKFRLQPFLVLFQSTLVHLCSSYSPCFTTASCGLARGKEEKMCRSVGTGKEIARSEGSATFANDSPTAKPSRANSGTGRHAGEREWTDKCNGVKDVSTKTRFVCSQASPESESQTCWMCLRRVCEAAEKWCRRWGFC